MLSQNCHNERFYGMDAFMARIHKISLKILLVANLKRGVLNGRMRFILNRKIAFYRGKLL